MNKRIRHRVSSGETDEAANYAAAYSGWSRYARYYHSRLHLVLELLKTVPGGALLDVGCGPGMLLQALVASRPGEFKVTAVDQSLAMLNEASARVSDEDGVEFRQGRAEDLPLDDASFDVVLAMGVLEYTDLPVALRELCRITRPGGLVLVTMLNPLSPHRLFEWCVYWPCLRLLGRVEGLVGIPEGRRHDAEKTGIHAYPAGRLARRMQDAGLEPHDLLYYDLTLLPPPLDRFVRRWNRGWRERPDKTVARGARGWSGTAYLIAARRD